MGYRLDYRAPSVVDFTDPAVLSGSGKTEDEFVRGGIVRAARLPRGGFKPFRRRSTRQGNSRRKAGRILRLFLPQYHWMLPWLVTASETKAGPESNADSVPDEQNFRRSTRTSRDGYASSSIRPWLVLDKISGFGRTAQPATYLFEGRDARHSRLA
jgi:hypothetical protein